MAAAGKTSKINEKILVILQVNGKKGSLTVEKEMSKDDILKFYQTQKNTRV